MDPLLKILAVFGGLLLVVIVYLFWPMKEDKEKEQRIREQRDRK